MNSPSPGRCIFNRDQSTQNKIQCQTHSPFTKFVLGLNETGGTFLAYPLISKYVWMTTNYFHPLGCTAQSGSSVIIQTMRRLPVFDHRHHLRLIVESVIQNGYKPRLSEQPTYIKNKCYTNTTYTSFQFISH